MFEAVRTFVYNRRRGIATTVGFVGGFYLAAQYVMERLEEIREQVVQEKTARENLRRRFQQNQQDCTYTILALVPTLGDKILEEMDVESVTHKLQMQSKAAKSRMQTLSSSASEVNTSSLSLNTDQPSITSSIELSMPSPARAGFDSESSQSRIESAQSWVEQFTADHSSSAPSETDQHDGPPASSSPTSSSGAHLSDSVTSASASLVSATNSERVSQLIESLHSVRSDYINSHPIPPNEDPSLAMKSKAELWREVKILTFTRTLTILYSTTLLSLLTHIQLNLLGRYKYVQSVLEMEREQKLKERQSLQATFTNLLWNTANLSNSSSTTSLLNEEIGNTLGLFGSGQTGHTERKYLTLSWWLLNVGWREVGDRVRVAVEAVFDEVSLKAKLGMEDLERLVKDTRQKVEFSHSQQSQSSNTVQDTSALPPRRISFLPSLIPVTPEGLKDVLEKGGLPPYLTDIDDTAFLQLVEDTRDFISSADFEKVLETCLDHASDILFDGLRRMVFPDGASTEGPSHLDKIRLAGMLPGVARWSHAAIYGTPNEIVEGLAEVRELAGFSAIIYSSYADTFR